MLPGCSASTSPAHRPTPPHNDPKSTRALCGRELARTQAAVQVQAHQLTAQLAQERAASAAAAAAHAAEREALLLDRDGVVCDVDRLVVQVQELEG